MVRDASSSNVVNSNSIGKDYIHKSVKKRHTMGGNQKNSLSNVHRAPAGNQHAHNGGKSVLNRQQSDKLFFKNESQEIVSPFSLNP